MTTLPPTDKDKIREVEIPEYPFPPHLRDLLDSISGVDTQGFLEGICRGNYDEGGSCIWDLAELRDAIDLRIAQSNYQAVQAFGEKVLGEAKWVAWDDQGGDYLSAVSVSVITSLMKGETK